MTLHPFWSQDFLTKNRDVLKDKIRGLFCVCGNRKQPTGPEQIKQLIDNHLSQITGVSGVPAKAFNGRITIGLVEPQYVHNIYYEKPSLPRRIVTISR